VQGFFLNIIPFETTLRDDPSRRPFETGTSRPPQGEREGEVLQCERGKEGCFFGERSLEDGHSGEASAAHFHVRWVEVGRFGCAALWIEVVV
jgi:hypothetical protein